MIGLHLHRCVGRRCLLGQRWILGHNFHCVGLGHNFRPLGLHLCHGCLGQRLLGHNHLIGLHLQHGCVDRRRLLDRNLYLLGLVLLLLGLNDNLLGLAITRIGIDLHVVGLDLYPGCIVHKVHLVLDLLGLVALVIPRIGLGLVIHRIGLGLVIHRIGLGLVIHRIGLGLVIHRIGLGLVIHRIGLGLLGVWLPHGSSTFELLLECFLPGSIPLDQLHDFWPPPQECALVAVLQPKVFFNVL